MSQPDILHHTFTVCYAGFFQLLKNSYVLLLMVSNWLTSATIETDGRSTSIKHSCCSYITHFSVSLITITSLPLLASTLADGE